MAEAFICDYVRTPFGRFGGALATVRTDDLAALPLKSLSGRNPDFDLAAVDDVILGCANQAGEDNRNVARMALLLAGYPDSVPGATINRLCGSGMDAIATAAANAMGKCTVIGCSLPRNATSRGKNPSRSPARASASASAAIAAR